MRYNFFLALFLISVIANAQPKVGSQSYAGNQYEKLKIGEKVPDDILFDHIINYKSSTAKISDFRGKVVVLDFWNLSCGPCIAAFPKMQELQAKFGDRMQILLVNVVNNWDYLMKSGFPNNTRSPIIPRITLPFVVPAKHLTAQDTKNGLPLRQLFAHAGEPFHAWIDEDGVLRATTKPGYVVTEESVLYFLKHKRLESGGESGVVQDLGMEEGENASILKLRNKIIEDKIMYSSVLLKNLNVGRGMSADLKDSITGKWIGFRREGRPFLDLYLTSLMWSVPQEESNRIRIFREENRIAFEVENPDIYIMPSDPYDANGWLAENTYYYEIRFPSSRMKGDVEDNRKVLYRTMKSDLENVFGVKSYVEKRNTQCWVLVRTSNIDKLESKKMPLPNGRSIEGLISWNSPFSTFFNLFALKNGLRQHPKPLINETGFSENKKVDLIIKGDLKDITSLRDELKKYDLDLIEKKREIEVLVISDKI